MRGSGNNHHIRSSASQLPLGLRLLGIFGAPLLRVLMFDVLCRPTRLGKSQSRFSSPLLAHIDSAISLSHAMSSVNATGMSPLPAHSVIKIAIPVTPSCVVLAYGSGGRRLAERGIAPRKILSAFLWRRFALAFALFDSQSGVEQFA